MLCCLSIAVAVILLFGIILLKIYTKVSEGWCYSPVCLVGKTVLVTGANIGIGYEAALDFAKRGAKVILACRNMDKAEEARRKIIEETGNENIHCRLVDMASFGSVRKFAKEINDTEERLDILVNNAGAVSLGNKRTVDGHQLLMQVNYFSSFLLTNLLINLLKKSQPSRIVNVSSMAAVFAKYFDLGKIDEYASDTKDYYNSKLGNVLFTMELAKRLEGTGVTTYSLHPGLVETNIFHNFKGVQQWLHAILVNLFAKSTRSGAQTTLYCSLTKGIEKYSGDYFSDCKRMKPFALMTKDPGLPKKLWEKTEDIVGLKADEIQL